MTRKKIRDNQKNQTDKNKEKEGILCEVGAFYTGQSSFKVFHACDSCTFEIALSKNGKIFSYFSYFCAFLPFYIFFNLFQSYLLIPSCPRTCSTVL